VRDSDQMFGLMGSTTQLAQATLSNTTSTDLIFPSHAVAVRSFYQGPGPIATRGYS
jgi:hypothetical protein